MTESKKTLLLDIDYTIMVKNTPRPHLKQFMEYVMDKYDVHFYTAGNRYRVTEALRVLVHQLEYNDHKTIHFLQRKALTSENCQTIEYKKESGTSITIKSFEKASEILGVPVADMIMLDDNPAFDHPNASQIIQAEGFRVDADEPDDYLLRLIQEGVL
jgi:hypothetical protein